MCRDTQPHATPCISEVGQSGGGGGLPRGPGSEGGITTRRHAAALCPAPGNSNSESLAKPSAHQRLCATLITFGLFTGKVLLPSPG